MRVLFIGDIFGEPGRKVLQRAASSLSEKYKPDFVIANGENSAHGAGITSDIADEIFASGVDLLTGGNHTFDKRAVWEKLDQMSNVLRPANFPDGVPGRGFSVLRKNGLALGVLNLQGRIEMAPIDSPFFVGSKIIEELRKETNCIIVDFHAEATAEKLALAYYFAGKVSAVIGTHTHVQTADERIIEGWTAYITDVGMCGVHDSIIGLDKETAMRRFLTQLPWTFKPAEGEAEVDYVVISILEEGKAEWIVRGQWSAG